MGCLGIVTLQIVVWMLYHLFIINVIAPLLCKLKLKRFDDYNEEMKKESRLRFASLLYVVKTACGAMVLLILPGDDTYRLYNLWGYTNLTRCFLLMTICYCFADILMQLIWKVRRKPWQNLHHVYIITLGGFVILVNEILLSSASFKLMADVFIPFLELLALQELRMNDNKTFRRSIMTYFAAYTIFVILFIPIHYYQFYVRERYSETRKLDEVSLIYCMVGGIALDLASFYSFLIISHIYWKGSSKKEEVVQKENGDNPQKKDK
ncbi:uncharacterized protein LOC143449901 isoform X2 [Clavelina lepadiformis]|uniref:uncharacterized protein LOC143449901 isoform X2 n=1 Tax=Clavelina lepadiformis TaxID=159417 RepID=UPI0040430523